MKKGLKWVIGILVVLYLFGRISGGGSSRSTGTRSAQQTAPAQQVQQETEPEKTEEQPAAEPVVQEQEEAEPVQQESEPVQQVQEEAQEQPAEAEAQTEAQEPADSGIPGVSAEFKNTMDEYEAFFDDYVEFMQMYKESNDVAMMGKYAEMMNQKEEQAYYIEVMSRISQKMLLASQ